MNCEMCGAESKLLKTFIEGSEMELCSNCSKFGKIVTNKPKFNSKFNKPNFPLKKKVYVREESNEELVKNYSQIIKNKRESLNLKQKDLAAKMAEKESIIHKIESGNFKPSIKLAKKFQRILRIRIIENVETKSNTKFKANSQPMTIGDLLSIKNKNK